MEGGRKVADGWWLLVWHIWGRRHLVRFFVVGERYVLRRL